MSPTTLEQLRMPLFVRGMNATGVLVRPLLRRQLDLEGLLRAAEAQTGLSDYGDRGFVRPLARLLQALTQEVSLSAFGLAAMRSHVLACLRKRLEVQRWLSRFEEIADQRVARPLFIVGLPRTGSTHLHHLLCADPAVRVPLLWQLMQPTPPPQSGLGERDPRIARARQAVSRGLRLNPALSKLHPHRADGPEECHYLLDLSFMNPLLPAGAAYERWFRAQDMREAYKYHRTLLRLLQWRWPGRHWVLKGGFHLWHLSSLASVYPDANFVFTHRDPAQVVPSTASYAAARSQVFFGGVDPAPLGSAVLQSLTELVASGLARRRCISDQRCWDVAYSDLVDSPIRVVEGIYDRFGYELDDTGRRGIARQLSRATHHSRGAHRYSLRQFGLSEERIAVSMSGYLDFLAQRGIRL